MIPAAHIHPWTLKPPRDGHIRGVCSDCGDVASWPDDGVGPKILTKATQGAADITIDSLVDMASHAREALLQRAADLEWDLSSVRDAIARLERMIDAATSIPLPAMTARAAAPPKHRGGRPRKTTQEV